LFSDENDTWYHARGGKNARIKVQGYIESCEGCLLQGPEAPLKVALGYEGDNDVDSSQAAGSLALKENEQIIHADGRFEAKFRVTKSSPEAKNVGMQKCGRRKYVAKLYSPNIDIAPALTEAFFVKSMPNNIRIDTARERGRLLYDDTGIIDDLYT
jgi:hypothetical protein